MRFASMTIIAVSFVVVVGACRGNREDGGNWVVKNHATSLWTLRCECERAGETVVVDVLYPEERVLLTSTDRECREQYAYEDVYLNHAEYEYRRALERGRRIALGGGFLNAVELEARANGTRTTYCRYEKVILRVTEEAGEYTDRATMLKSVLSSIGGIAARAVLTRPRVEQKIGDVWEKLTPYLGDIAFDYYVAPQDTICLRVRPFPMRVEYRIDRVEISRDDGGNCTPGIYRVSKHEYGIWPNRKNQQEFFKSFTALENASDEWLGMRYEIWPYAHVYLVDLEYLSCGRYESIASTLAIRGATMDLPEDPRKMSVWPVEVDPCANIENRELGYPGGIYVPDWAYRRLMDLGREFTRANRPNRKRYGIEY